MSAFIIKPLQPEDEAAVRLGSDLMVGVLQVPKPGHHGIEDYSYYLMQQYGTRVESNGHNSARWYDTFKILYRVDDSGIWGLSTLFTRRIALTKISEDGLEGFWEHRGRERSSNE